MNNVYIVRSSERLRKSGADAEAKALLYMMNYSESRNEIYYYIVDLFNDLTGMDRNATRLWDLQSKGSRGVGAKAIGKELVTLFKNYMSRLPFEAYILFVGSISGNVRKFNDKKVFGKENIKDEVLTLMKEGLHEEGERKQYIKNSWLTNENFDEFLSKVTFVVDNDVGQIEYVKEIIKNYPNIIPEDNVLQAIFNEIRDKISIKKNANVVEGAEIRQIDDIDNLDYFEVINDDE